MRTSIIFITLLTLLIAACDSRNSKVSDISGTYVTQFSNEYTNTSDTLIIAPIESAGTSYTVVRRTGFNKIRDGKPLDKEFKATSWTSTFDQDNLVLKETDLGKQIYVLPDKEQVKLGSSEYTKIK